MPFNLGIMEVVFLVAVLGAISAVVRHLGRRSTRNEQLEAGVRDLENQIEEERLHEQLRRPD